MKFNKIFALAALTLSLQCNSYIFAAESQPAAKPKSKKESSTSFSHTAEKIAAMSQLIGACAESWASENQDIKKSTKNLISGLASAARLTSGITTQVINMNEDSSQISLAHTPWIIFDASQLASILFDSANNQESVLSELEGLLTTNPTDQLINEETHSSLQIISRHLTAAGEGAAVVAASFLRERETPITIGDNILYPEAARKICYTLSSIMRSGNILLASKPSKNKTIFAVGLVAYSVLLIYQLSRSAIPKDRYIDEAEIECYICMKKGPGDDAFVRPCRQQGHALHQECLAGWRASGDFKGICGVCRGHLFDEWDAINN